jgi:diguanylate cyclase (GGDEF)-like protein
MTGLFVERATIDEPALGHEAADLADRVVEAIVQACGRVQIFQRLVEQRERLSDIANTDELTGCATRRSVKQYLEGQLESARERGDTLSIVVLDLDHFKQINDSCGHIAGDAVLRELGSWLGAEGAASDGNRPGRYGGDEFVVVLPGMGTAAAQRFAERARAHISSIPFVFGDVAVRATLSAGIAAWPEIDATTADELISVADAALYVAKQRGRDQVCLSPAVSVG